MTQQLAALDWLAGRRWGALFMEQGTGKTWTLLADAERAWKAGKITGLFVLAPNGVHTNWVRREIPIHLEAPHVARAWRSGLSPNQHAELQRALFVQPKKGCPLYILTMNFEALQSKVARDFVVQFMQTHKSIYVVDESQKIKNESAAATKHATALRPLSAARRISTGTPMDKPGDIYSQMHFLKEGLLGTSSYRAFMAEYAVLANWREPRTDADWMMKRQVERHPRMAHAVIVATDDVTGQPMYRNLDKLNRLVAAESFRVLKSDCLDLPPKVYQTIYFDLTPKQRAAYDLMEKQYRILMDDGEVTPVSALSSLIKLQQITSGYVMVPGDPNPMYVEEANPRIAALAEAVAMRSGKMIVWARFREEVAAICARLRADKRRVVEYHGGVSAKLKEEAIDRLQAGDADVFVGVQKAGGTGLTLTAAETTIYCSNEHSAIVRAQSEDRNHRKGTTGTVVYIDIAATDTVDESIAKAHQFKTALSAAILGDRGLDFGPGITG